MSERPVETGSEGLPKRWSARRKSEIVLRLLRGGDLGELSREIKAPELERWGRLFPEGAGEGLKGRNAPGPGLRRDWSLQYRARAFQAETEWLEIRSTLAYVGNPECNGVAERLIRTLTEAHRGLHRPLQQRLAAPAARVSDPGPREARPEEGGLMVTPSLCPENRHHYISI